MAKGTDYLNIETHPLDLGDDGYVGAGEHVELSRPGPEAQSYIDTGVLVARSEPSGRRNPDPLADQTADELQEQARSLGVEVASGMKKAELVKAIRRAQEEDRASSGD